MKIICVGMNYPQHTEELGAMQPTARGTSGGKEPTIFMKPDTALLRGGMPFFIPDWAERFDYECELVYRISRLGRCIEPRFAHRYYDAVGLGIDFTARDLQERQRSEGLPWEISKGFDQSAAISPRFISMSDIADARDIRFELRVNGELRQSGTSGEMTHGIDEIISYVSRYFSLRIGDLIFTGTPAGVGPVKIGDRLTGTINGQEMLDFMIK